MTNKTPHPKTEDINIPKQETSKYANTILANLNELSSAVYKDAMLHGLWKNNPSNEHFLMQTMVEISEAIQANTINKRADISIFKQNIAENNACQDNIWFDILFETDIKNTVQDELADVVLMLLSFCGYRRIYIDNHSVYQSYARLEYADIKPQTFEEFCFDLCKLITDGCVIEPIYIVMAYCERNNIDLAWHIEQKMKYNSTRADHNHKKN